MNGSEANPISSNDRLMLVTDGSLFSEGAILEAISLAKRCSSKLHVISLMLVMSPESETIDIDIARKGKAEILRHLESVEARAVQEGLPSCEDIFCEGPEPYYQMIIDEAADRQIDMIIIGRRGHKGLAKILSGELAAQVIGHAQCKVLVVPKAAKIGYKNLLVATDGSKHAEAAAKEAINIAKNCSSNIIAVSVCRTESELEDAESNVNKVAVLAQRESMPVETLTPVGRPYEVIAETAGGRGVDLIVMGAYGKTGLEKMLMGSSTEKVIGLAGCAVLVVKSQ